MPSPAYLLPSVDAFRLESVLQERLQSGTPCWITFELPPTDMKAASVGILDQIVATQAMEPRISSGRAKEEQALVAQLVA